MGIRERKTTLVEISEHRNLAEGLTDYLFECRNEAHRCIFTTATTREEVVMMMEEFLSTIDKLPIDYDRSQYINDLILLLKAGNASVAKNLADVMGFLQETNELVFNVIDYKNIEDNIEESEESDPAEGDE